MTSPERETATRTTPRRAAGTGRQIAKCLQDINLRYACRGGPNGPGPRVGGHKYTVRPGPVKHDFQGVTEASPLRAAHQRQA